MTFTLEIPEKSGVSRLELDYFGRIEKNDWQQNGLSTIHLVGKIDE
jgi:hypothetical protein